MLRSRIAVPVVSALCLLALQASVPVAYASPVRASANMHAFVGTKMVKLHLTNNTGETLKVQMGNTSMTIEAGQTVDLNVSAGTKIVNLEATKNHAAGEILTEVSSAISGATIKVS